MAEDIAWMHLLCGVFPCPGGQSICLKSEVQTIVPMLATAIYPADDFACKELDAWREKKPLNHLGCQWLTPVTLSRSGTTPRPFSYTGRVRLLT